MTTLWISPEDDEITPAVIAEIQRCAPDMTIAVGRDLASAGIAPDDVEIAGGWFGAEALLRMPNLRWAQHWAAGVEAFTTNSEIATKDFVLTNGSGIHAVPITEHILGLLLAFGRSLHTAVRNQRDHCWRTPGTSTRPDLFELAGKTLLLIGVGAIGAHAAQAAAALGIRVMGMRRNPALSVSGVSRMVGPEALLDSLPDADFVVVTAPLTPATRRMIGERELRAMKSTAILINIGRGGTIDEVALIQALRENRIAGAGLDVFETEPLPVDSPLWDMDNVIITAHYAGNTPAYTERALDLFLDNLHRYRTGIPLRNVVDMERGY